jgi:hypothetical protein
MGFEKGVVHTLELFLDEFTQYRLHQREIVTLLDQCIEQTSKMVAVGGQMHESIAAIKRAMKQGDELAEGE